MRRCLLCKKLEGKAFNNPKVAPCNLMNAIFSQVVDHRVHELRKEKCCGCKIDHPSQRRHNCLMMTEEEGWITYGLEAIEYVVEKGILHVETIQGSYPNHATHPSRACSQTLSKTLE